jgi:hypothetical protein
MAPHEEGHVHDDTPAPPSTAPASAIGARLILTLVGAAAMIVGAFLEWVKQGEFTVKGTKIGYTVFWDTDPSFEPSFLASAGFVMIVIGLITLLGIAMSTGWLSRLGAVLGLIAVALFVITLYRVADAELSIGNVGIGIWLILAGSILALVGGFVQQRPAVA